MKILPTMEGGLRIDPETEADWHILRAIILDANGHDTDLAARLGNMIANEAIADDWKEYIIPDLRESFSDDLHHVYASIETAAAFPVGDETPIWITRADSSKWYSALNQARLALEEIYQFGPEPETDPKNFSPLRKDALIRSRVYCTLQGLILDHAWSA